MTVALFKSGGEWLFNGERLSDVLHRILNNGADVAQFIRVLEVLEERNVQFVAQIQAQAMKVERDAEAARAKPANGAPPPLADNPMYPTHDVPETKKEAKAKPLHHNKGRK